MEERRMRIRGRVLINNLLADIKGKVNVNVAQRQNMLAAV